MIMFLLLVFCFVLGVAAPHFGATLAGFLITFYILTKLFGDV